MVVNKTLRGGFGRAARWYLSSGGAASWDAAKCNESVDQTINEHVSRNTRTVNVHHWTQVEQLMETCWSPSFGAWTKSLITRRGQWETAGDLLVKFPTGGTTYGKHFKVKEPKIWFSTYEEPPYKIIKAALYFHLYKSICNVRVKYYILNYRD